MGSKHSTAAESRKDDLRCFSGDAYVSPAPEAAADTAVSSGIERGGEVDHAVIGEIAKLELKDDDADVAVTVEPLAADTAVSSGIERGGEIAKLELKDDDADVAATVEPLAAEEEKVVEAVEEEEEKSDGVGEVDHAVIGEIAKLELKDDDADVAVTVKPSAAEEEKVVEAVEEEEEKSDGVGEVDHAVIGEIAKLELKDDDADVAATVEPLATEEEKVVEAVEVEEEEEEKSDGVEIGEKSEDDVEVVEKKKGGENGRWRQYPLRPEAKVCFFYLKTGVCKFGSNCKYNHPVRRKTYNQGFRERVKEKDEFSDYPSQTECKYYSGPGRCKYRKGCRYIHGKGKGPVAPVEELNFLGLPIRQGERECPCYMRTGSCKFGTNCKYTHPDPTAAGGSDPPSGFVGNNGPTPLQGGSQSLSWTAPRSLNETPPYMPMMMPPSQGVPSRNSEWNGYQPPFYPDRGMPAPPPYVINDSVIETNVYKQYPQSNQVDEFPERPGQPLCKPYLRTGDCKFKFNCKYHHPKSQTVVSRSFTLGDKGLPLRPDQNICTHYSRYGICKFGSACKYDHPIHLTSSTTSDLANTREVGIAENTSRTDNIIHL